MVGQAKVVVGAEVKDSPSRNGYLSALWRADEAFCLIQASLLDRGELLSKMFPEIVVHGIGCFYYIKIGMEKLSVVCKDSVSGRYCKTKRVKKH